jgi:HPt (histidine-containing phosphotransfer) domain-containing protein
MTEETTAEQIQVNLAGIWYRTYPLVLERLTKVENAAVELSKASPRVETVVAGHDEAHKLAGALGTFGLNRGTQLARALERRLSNFSRRQDAGETERLAAELRSTIERARVG